MRNTLRNILKTIPVSLALGFFITLNSNLAMGAWSSDERKNMAICTAPGQQSFPQIISDGAGGAIMTWEDARNVHFDIYAQRVDAEGNISWIKDGIPVCTMPEKQDKPRIISDSAGGAIITWHDIRSGNGNYDIYAQRISADGKPQWTENGIPVCTEINAQDSPSITPDGDGGALIIWQDFRTNYADLYAQRINKNGEPLWAKNGVLVCGYSGAQSAPVIVDDGAGGAIVVWQDFRRSYADIYAQRIDGSGNVLWEKGGVALCTASGHESPPVIVSTGAEGAIAAWVDTRNGNNDIFAQHVDGNGDVHWTANGIPVCTAPNNQNYPIIIRDGAGGAILGWWDMRSKDFNIYVQHVDLNGNILWKKDGLAICVEPGIQNYVNLTGDDSGGAVMVWDDNRASTFDIYAQRIDSKGESKWRDNGIICSTAPNAQCFPMLIHDGTGGAIIVWQDGRNIDKNYWDIYAQKINGQGTLGNE